MQILFLLVLIMAIHIPASAAVKLPENVTVPAIIAFGDSYLDPGNNDYTSTLVKCNFPPYGRDFIGRIPTGRFSNGRILTDFFVEEFSIKPNLPAYLDPSLVAEDLLTGVSFASGGSGYDNLTLSIAKVTPLFEQLENFKVYISKLKQLVGEEKAEFIINNSIFIVSTGNNDFWEYFDNPFKRKGSDIHSFTDHLISLASKFIQELYDLGARRISIMSVLGVGCWPIQRTVEGGIVRECAEANNRDVELFNAKLSAQIHSLRSQLPNSRVAYIDAYTPFINIIQNHRNYGFEQEKIGCCGTGLIEVLILCNKLSSVCPDASKYLFWDSIHLTERGAQVFFRLIIRDYGNLLFGTQP